MSIDERTHGEARERTWLDRRYAGIIDQCRLEFVGRRLAEGAPMAVEWSRPGFAGDRWRLLLDCGDELRLKLYDPYFATAIALRSISWVGDLGWRIVLITEDGEQHSVLAYEASLRIHRAIAW